MSAMSVGQCTATGVKDEAGDLTEPDRSGDLEVPGGEPVAASRLERELRSSRPLARELRAHQRLTRELRARGSLAGQPQDGERQGGERQDGGPRGAAPRYAAIVPARRGRGIRLTRRGRRVVVGFVAAVAVAAAAALWLAAATRAQAANHGVAPGTVEQSMTAVVVQPGQTLWSIALRAEPAADPRVVISQIVEFNALGSDVVVPGERIWVPRS
jgi:nucleoid-associated protein YgaU